MSRSQVTPEAQSPGLQWQACPHAPCPSPSPMGGSGPQAFSSGAQFCRYRHMLSWEEPERDACGEELPLGQVQSVSGPKPHCLTSSDYWTWAADAK